MKSSNKKRKSDEQVRTVFFFDREKENILSSEEKFRKHNERVKVGVETEYFLIREDFKPLNSSKLRNDIIEDLDEVKKELGIDSVEIAIPPVILENLGQLEESISDKESKLNFRAKDKGLKVIRSGTNPFRSLENLNLTEKSFFRKINDYYNEKSTEFLSDKEKFDVGNAKSTSLISAIHTNIEASDFEDAVEKANYIYMISPYISAVSGNARFIDEEDTGLSDLRMILWSKSHSTGDKEVGRLNSYYSDIRDYFDRVGSWPFIMNRADKVISDSISRFWKDSRIKFLDSDIVVESRIASTQPSVKDDVAVHGFCIGRLLYAQDNDEELLDIEKVNKNREKAMTRGLDAELYSPEGEMEEAVEVLEKEIQKAKKGLKNHGINGVNFLDVLDERIKDKEAPSDEINKKLRDGMDDREFKSSFMSREDSI